MPHEQARFGTPEEVAGFSSGSPFTQLMQDYIAAHGGSGIFLPEGNRYLHVSIPLLALLTSSISTAKDRYIVPLDYLFLTTSIRADVQPIRIDVDAISYAGSTITNPQIAKSFRMQNCRVSLQNTSRSQYLIGPRGTNSFDAGLASLSEPDGGAVLTLADLGVAGLVGPGETLESTVTLASTTASENANGARYGVLLSGLLLYLGPSNRAKA